MPLQLPRHLINGVRDLDDLLSGTRHAEVAAVEAGGVHRAVLQRGSWSANPAGMACYQVLCQIVCTAIFVRLAPPERAACRPGRTVHNVITQILAHKQCCSRIVQPPIAGIASA